MKLLLDTMSLLRRRFDEIISSANDAGADDRTTNQADCIHRIRDMYLDLLIKCVSNTIYGDAAMDAAGLQHAYSPEARRLGADWPTKAHTMIGLLRLQNLKEMTELVLQEGVPGDFIETGVWRGGACILMRAILAVHGITNRTVYVADSFCGLPPPTPELYPADAGSVFHTYNPLQVSRAEVEEAFKLYDLLDERVAFVEGWFKDTLSKIPTNQFALIRLDGDMYESTIQSLEALYPKLSRGGIIIVDDYGAIKSCSQAVDDFRSAARIDAPITAIDSTIESGIWWRKP